MKYIRYITDPVSQALIGGAGSLLTSGINAIAGAIQNKKNREHEKEMMYLEDSIADENAAVAYQRQLDMWNKQNDYNDPSAQVARLRRAGLNPAMITGSNVVNQAGSMSSAPQSSGGKASPRPQHQIHIEDMFQSALQAYASGMQLNLVDAQTEKTMQEAFGEYLTNRFKGMTEAEAIEAFREELRAKRLGNDATEMGNELTRDAYFNDEGNVVDNPLLAELRKTRSEATLNESIVHRNTVLNNLTNTQREEIYANISLIEEKRVGEAFANVERQVDAALKQTFGYDVALAEFNRMQIDNLSAENKIRLEQLYYSLDAYIKTAELTYSGLDAQLKSLKFYDDAVKWRSELAVKLFKSDPEKK